MTRGRATSGAKKTQEHGLDRGQRRAHVLPAAEEETGLLAARKCIVDQLAMPEAATIELDPPRLPEDLHRPPDLS